MHSAVSLLSAHNVVVGLGVEEQWSSRNLRFDVGLVRFSLCNFAFCLEKVFLFIVSGFS
jgi:hypothetical protein